MESRFSISSITLLLERVIFVVVADDTIFSLFFRIVRIVEVDKFNAVPISDCRSPASNRLSTCILVSSEMLFLVALLSFSLQSPIVKKKKVKRQEKAFRWKLICRCSDD